MALIESRRLANPKMSVSRAAKLAGLSEGRWRQLAKGYQQATTDTRIAAKAPADTLVRMAQAVGVTAEQLRAAGRSDAADQWSNPEETHTPQSDGGQARHLLNHMWSVAEQFADDLVMCEPLSAELRESATRLVNLYGAYLADQLIAHDLPSGDRDKLLAELYRRRDVAEQKIASGSDGAEVVPSHREPLGPFRDSEDRGSGKNRAN